MPALPSASVSPTFEELVEMQRAANAAHAQAEQLRDQYGPPTLHPWSEQQARTYETAWRAGRDLTRDVQNAVTEYAKNQGEARQDVEARLKNAAGHVE